MPVRPPPNTYRCRSCGWQRTFFPRRDCMMEGLDYVTACPRCKSEDIEIKDNLATRLTAFVWKWTRRQR